MCSCSDSKSKMEMKQFDKHNEYDTAATHYSNEPEYEVIGNTVHSTGDYDYTKCPAYAYPSNPQKQ